MKVSRAAFLYLEPKERDNKETFAQCSSCRLFVPAVKGLKGGRCVIHGSGVEIDPGATCGFYVDWPRPGGNPDPAVVHRHAEELAGGLQGSVTPAESGLVDERVQCRNCASARDGATVCGLYRRLNAAAGGVVNFYEKIKPHACCNAWTKRVGKA